MSLAVVTVPWLTHFAFDGVSAPRSSSSQSCASTTSPRSPSRTYDKAAVPASWVRNLETASFVPYNHIVSRAVTNALNPLRSAPGPPAFLPTSNMHLRTLRIEVSVHRTVPNLLAVIRHLRKVYRTDRPPSTAVTEAYFSKTPALRLPSLAYIVLTSIVESPFAGDDDTTAPYAKYWSINKDPVLRYYADLLLLYERVGVALASLDTLETLLHLVVRCRLLPTAHKTTPTPFLHALDCPRFTCCSCTAGRPWTWSRAAPSSKPSACLD